MGNNYKVTKIEIKFNWIGIEQRTAMYERKRTKTETEIMHSPKVHNEWMNEIYWNKKCWLHSSVLELFSL